jgi:hypothetical protein
MASINFTQMQLVAAAGGTMGLPTSGDTSFAITTDTCTGSLIASGGGSSTFMMTSNTPQLIASLSADGSTSMTFTTNTPLLGALAFNIASASLTFSGSLLPYAIGQMVGDTLNGGALTAQSVAQAVWGQTLEGTYTAAEMQKLIAAVLAGKVSGAGSNAPIFRDINDTKNRVTATTDASGNRTSVTLDPS